MSCVIGKTFQQALQPYKYLFADTGTHVPFFCPEMSLWSWNASSVLDGGTSRATCYPYKSFPRPREVNQCAVEQIDGAAQ